MDASGALVFAGAMTDTLPRFVVATAMRDEGPFIVEWVAWYRMLGFEILVATNDCSDRSPDLLDALEAAGWVKHIRHAPPVGEPPQKAAHKVLSRHPDLQSADWVLSCDVDEFLVLHVADNILHYVGSGPWNYLGVAFNWKIFGTGGWQRYRPGLVHDQFRRAGVSRLNPNRYFKSMFRRPDLFDRIGAHSPHGFAGDWRLDENAWLTTDGVELQQFRDPANHPVRLCEPDQIAHTSAQMNHYVLRSQEHWNAKKGTPAAANFNDRYDDAFFKRHNRNGIKDTSARRFAPLFRPFHQAAMAAPEVARLHHLCCADYVARLCRHQGQDHRIDERWVDAMAAAG